MKQLLIQNIDQLHTTKLGIERVKKNLNIEEDVVEYCKKKIFDKGSQVYRQRKNYYVETQDCIFTIHANSYTIITAHLKIGGY